MIGAAYIGSQRANSRILLSTTVSSVVGSTTSYTIPSGAIYIDVELIGGGEVGGNGAYSPASGGGRGGAAVPASSSGGNGGGGAARVRHRYSGSITSGDLLYYSVAAGKTTSQGLNTYSALESHTRSATTILTFSPQPRAGSGLSRYGGTASSGNISNQDGSDGSIGLTNTQSGTFTNNGADGGNPGGGAATKGLGGIAASNTAPTAGGVPGGGGGGGYGKVGASVSGAYGGNGQVTMTAYG